MTCIVSHQISKHLKTLDELEEFDEWLEDYEPTEKDVQDVIEYIYDDGRNEILLLAVMFLLKNDIHEGQLSEAAENIEDYPQSLLEQCLRYVENFDDISEFARLLLRACSVSNPKQSYLLYSFSEELDEFLKESPSVYQNFLDRQSQDEP